MTGDTNTHVETSRSRSKSARLLRMALFDTAMFTLLAAILLGLSHFTYGGPDGAQDAIVELIERPMTLQGASTDRWVMSGATGDDDDKTCIRSLTPADTEDDDDSNDVDVWTYEGACQTVIRAVEVAGSSPVETVRVAQRISESYTRPTLTRSVNLVGGYLPFFEPIESPSTDPTNRHTYIAGIDIRAIGLFSDTTQSYGTAEITIDGFHIDSASGSGIHIAAPTIGVIPFVIGPSEVKLTIKNSWIHGNNGGGIYVDSGVKATVTLENVYIYENTTTGSGGGVYIAGVNNKLIAKQTIIYDNSATNNGGGVFVSSASLDVGQNSEIKDNEADGNGGGLYVTGSVTATVAGITMTGNSAVNGAGIYAQNSSLVVGADTNVSSNSADDSGGGIYLSGGAPTVGAAIVNENDAAAGGGIYLNATAASVSGAFVMSNSVTSNGGGVYVQNSSAITVSSLTLFSNSATSAGGGIYVTGGTNVTFAGNTGIGNSTSGSGGGFHALSTLVHLNGNVWTGNSATANGGGVYVQSANNSTINNETAQGNIADGNGGGVFVTNSNNVVVDNLFVEENEAQNGGGFYAASSSVNLDSPTIFKNESSQHGGGLYATGGATLTFGGSATISQNIADGNGGGGYWTGASVVTFDGLTLSANEADHGGGFYVTNAKLTTVGPTLIQANNALSGNGGGFHFAPSAQTSVFSDLFLQSNTATGSGGGLYADDTDLTFGTANIQANEAISNGGGIYIVDNTLNVTGTFNLQANEAGGDGGGLYALRAPLSFAAQATIAENVAGGDGGGAFLNQPGGGLGAANFALLTLSENSANDDGGGVYANRVVLTFAAGSTFGMNDSILGSGGAFYVTDASLALSGVTLNGNSAFTDGGGVYLSGANLTVNASALTENKTLSGSGGALYAASSPSVVISGTTATKNVAAMHGGAIYADESTSTLQNNVFGENSTEQGSGGALYLTGGTGTSTGSTFDKNVAKTSGGAIYADVSSLTVTNATVTENGATDGSGGGLYIDAATAQLLGSTLSKNSAASGGGLYLTTGSPLGAAATLTGNTISENSSAGNGGGLTIQQAGAALLNNTIRLNQAGGSGGGMYLLHSRVGITNSLVVQNKLTVSTTYAAGIYLGNSELNATHTTFADNTNEATGGTATAIYAPAPVAAEGGAPTFSTLTILNSILSGQDIGVDLYAGNSASLQSSLWNNTRFDWNGFGTFATVTNNRRGDPRFQSTNNFRLRRDSAAFDIAAASSVITDLDGTPRPRGFAPDAGAFEHRYTNGLYLHSSASPTFALQGDTISYTLRVRNQSNAAINNAKLTLVFPQSQPSPAISPGSCSGIFCEVNLGTLAVDATAQVDITVVVAGAPPATGMGNMVVNVTLSGDGVTDSDKTAAIRTYLHSCRVRMNGTSYTTIQEAVDAAADGATIQVGGTCGAAHQSGGPGQAVALAKTLMIQGGWNGDFTQHNPALFPTTIDAANLGRVFYITGNVAPTLENLNLRNGNATALGGGESGKDAGGGMYVATAGLTLLNVDVAQNQSPDHGAGLYLYTAAPVSITNSAFRSNTAGERGGGVYIRTGSPSFLDVSVLSNKARSGGGYYIVQATPTIDTASTTLANNLCRINTNQATGSARYLPDAGAVIWLGPGGGGGVAIESSQPVVRRCAITGNSAKNGAGVFVLRSGMALENNVLASNTMVLPLTPGDGDADGNGGGLHILESDPATVVVRSNALILNDAQRGSALYTRFASGTTASINRSTIAHNTGAGAIYIVGQSDVSFADTILANNRGVAVAAATGSGGEAATVALNRTLWYLNDSEQATIGGNASIVRANDFTGDPAFKNDGYHIKRISAAYNLGINNAALADRDGDTRPQALFNDLGADEYNPAGVVRYVALGGVGGAPCTNYLQPCGSLQTAIDAAQDGDLIKMTGGVYSAMVERNGSTQIAYVDKSITIQGGYFAQTDNQYTEGNYTFYDWEDPHPNENPTMLDALNNGRSLTIVTPNGSPPITPTFAFLTLRNGNADGLGGGSGGEDAGGNVYADGASPNFHTVLIEDGRGQQGAGIYLRDASGALQTTTLTGNTSTQRGGGIYIEGGSPTLMQLTLQSNVAISGSAIYMAGGSATLMQNTATGNGGETSLAGGGFYLESSTSTVISNTVSGNRAALGGGLYLADDTSTVRGNTVTTNQAIGASGARTAGGGLYIRGGEPVVEANAITNNKTLGTACACGGGLHLDATAAHILANSVTGNEAPAGGGLYAENATGIKIRNNLFENNRALPEQSADGPTIKGGGGMLLASSSGTVEANTLRANRGDVGGGIYLTGASLALVADNTLTGNIATRNGGGFFTQNSTAQVTANSVWGNTATQGSGGGFYIASGDTPGVIYAGNVVTGNVAALSGGGFYIGAEGIRVENGNISGNRAADGAGVYLRGTLNSPNVSITRIERTPIQNNIASNHGGGLFMRQSSARVQAVVISGNRAGADGGGAYLDESSARLFADTLVQDNTAGNRGGGLALIRRSHATLVSNAVVGNEANGAGGGIFIAGSSPTLEHTTLADNGTALLAESLNQDGATVSLLNTIIADHQLGVDAGSGAAVSLQATLWDGNAVDNLGTVQKSLDVIGSAAFMPDGYHLSPTSDAIGKGLESAVGAFTDIDGQSRFQGTGPELGADELVADCDIIVGNNTFPVYHVLQDAIDAAPNNGLIRVAGTCTQFRNTGERPQIGAISKDLTIRGGYEAGNWQVSTPITRPTVLDADELGRVFYITGGSNRVTLQGLILTGGSAVGLGGGPLDADAGGNIFVQNAEVILQDSRVTGGAADFGGGIYANSQVVRLERNRIRFNRATERGGGIYLANGGADAVVNANDITSNEATEGAGLYVTGGAPVVSGNLVKENFALVLNGRGGGIYALDSQAVLRGNRLFANRAQEGGGAYLAATDGSIVPNFHNNMLGRNRSETSGGALYILDAPVILRHNTFSANTYGQDTGGAIMIVADAVSPVEVELINSIVANHNTAISLTADVELFVRADLWHNNQTNWPQPDGFPGTVTDLAGHQFADPLFIDTTADNYHIPEDSPAVDRGVNAGINVDIDNQTRPGRLGFDIGADEFLAAAFNVALSALPNPVPSGQDINFTVEIVNNGDVDVTADIQLNLPDVVSPKGPTIWTSVSITRNAVVRRETLATVDPTYTGALEATVNVTTLEGVTGLASVSANAVDVDTQILDILAQTTPNPVPPGSEVRYQLRVTNKGAIPLNTTVEVELPDGITSASPLEWTPTIAGSDGLWSTSFRADVPANAPEILETVVRVTSSEGVSAIYTATAELARPEVTATVRGQPRPAIAGEPVLFTLGVTNTGNVALTANISHTLGGHMAVEGAAGALSWEVPLAPGASWTEEVSATVEAGYEGALSSTLDVQSSVASTSATDTFQSQRPAFEFSATARGGIWHDPDSWEPSGVPQADDVVRIPPGVVITLTQAAEVRGLRNEGDLRVAGDPGKAQELSVAEAMENFGTIICLNGTSNGAPGISLDLRAGTLYNEGTIRGGNGAPDGGAGGHITISTTSLTNKGTIRAGDGADVLSRSASLPGGAGGHLIITLDPGLLVNDGTLASGDGGNAFANAVPPQPGGPGGNITIISPSTIDVDDSDVTAGEGGDGSNGASSGLQGTIYIGAYRISTTDARLNGRTVTLVDGSQNVFDFTAQAPAIVRGRVGGFPIIFAIRVVNRGSEADTFTISASKVPEGWNFPNLPSFVSLSPFRSRVITLALIPPATEQESAEEVAEEVVEEAVQAETTIELLVTSQTNTSRKILLPIELGPPLSESLGTVVYLPLVSTRASVSTTESESASTASETRPARAARTRTDAQPALFLPRIQDR